MSDISLLDKVQSFDLKSHHVIILFLIIISGYILVALTESDFLNQRIEYQGTVLNEDCLSYGIIEKRNLCGDYILREFYLSEWKIDWLVNDFRHGIVLSLLVLSRELFGEPRVLAFVSSIVFLVLTFFLAKQITNRKFAGLIAMLFVIISPIFYKYDTGITYPTFWASFYLASIYAMFKLPKLSFIAFMFSLFFKNIVLLYLPASILFAKFSKIESSAKKFIIISHVSVVVLAIGFIVYSDNGFASQFQINLEDFVWWLGMWAIEFANDRVSLFTLFFALGGLFILKKQNVPNAYAVLLLLVVIILQPAFISGFTQYTNEDYRFVVAIAFIGISIGLIITNFGKLVYGIQRPTG